MRGMKNREETLKDRVIVALDLPGYDAAAAMVETPSGAFASASVER